MVIFIATPGTGNIQPALRRCQAALKASGKTLQVTQIATGAATNARAPRPRRHSSSAHKTSLKGAFAVDAARPGSSARH